MHLDPPARIRLTYTPYPRLIRSLKPLPLFFLSFPVSCLRIYPAATRSTPQTHTPTPGKKPLPCLDPVLIPSSSHGLQLLLQVGKKAGWAGKKNKKKRNMVRKFGRKEKEKEINPPRPKVTLFFPPSPTVLSATPQVACKSVLQYFIQPTSTPYFRG